MNRIDGNQLSQLQSQAKKANAPAISQAATTKTNTESGVAATASDSVQISDAGRQLNELEKTMDTSAFNKQKVDLVKQAVDDGTYKPNAMNIANTMLSMDN